MTEPLLFNIPLKKLEFNSGSSSNANWFNIKAARQIYQKNSKNYLSDVIYFKYYSAAGVKIGTFTEYWLRFPIFGSASANLVPGEVISQHDTQNITNWLTGEGWADFLGFNILIFDDLDNWRNLYFGKLVDNARKLSASSISILRI